MTLNTREEGLRRREGEAKQMEQGLAEAKQQLESCEVKVAADEALQEEQ